MKNRRGVTLTELLIAMVIVGIIGAAFTRLMVTQGRFFDGQNALRSARTVSRGALNIMTSDLRMVEPEGGVAQASRDTLELRVPYAFGLFCGSQGSVSAISVQPIDSVIWNNAGFSGYAWRDASGGFSYTQNATLNPSGGGMTVAQAAGTCQGASITTVQGGNVARITPALAPSVTAGYPVLLFQRIMYTFGPSQMVPGRRGLWREVEDLGGRNRGVPEEIAAPFDTSAKFRFYLLDRDTSETLPGRQRGSLAQGNSVFDELRGIELVLDGMSERTPGGSPGPKLSQYTTAVFFQNRMK